jgi:hypothetical protein
MMAAQQQLCRRAAAVRSRYDRWPGRAAAGSLGVAEGARETPLQGRISLIRRD